MSHATMVSLSAKGTTLLVSEEFINSYFLLKELYAASSTPEIDIDHDILEDIVNPSRTFSTSTEDEKTKFIKVVNTIDYLGPNSSVWDDLILRLPRDYDIILSPYLCEKFWSSRCSTNISLLPLSYYNDMSEESSWRDILTIVDYTLNTKTNHLYISHLIMERLRKANLTISDYEELLSQLTLESIDPIVDTSGNKLFTYAKREYKNTGIFCGYPELFEMLYTANNQFMPKNIITYNPDDLTQDDLDSLVLNYSFISHSRLLSVGTSITQFATPIMQKYLQAWSLTTRPQPCYVRTRWKYKGKLNKYGPYVQDISLSYVVILLEDYASKIGLSLDNFLRATCERYPDNNLVEMDLRKYINNLDLSILGKTNENFIRALIPVSDWINIVAPINDSIGYASYLSYFAIPWTSVVSVNMLVKWYHVKQYIKSFFTFW